MADATKRPFLVLHDYGMGGIWAYIWAESEQQITDQLEVTVVPSPPQWLVGVDERLGEAIRLPTLDIDQPIPEAFPRR
jgi:hypothetical protein